MSENNRDGDEPIFTALSHKNAAMNAAFAQAARSIPRFIEHLQSGADAYCAAKLRFRDPDESERLGQDRFIYLWMGMAQYHSEERVFSGAFFELPKELEKWHHLGQRLAFDGEDIFDWMVITQDGRLFGGYTLRVSRNELPESERADYDSYIGVRSYEPEQET